MHSMVGLSEDAYTKSVIAAGEDYAWYYTHHNEEAAEMLMNSTQYWQWYIQQFLLREETFLKVYGEYNGIGGEQVLFELWMDTHEPQAITARPGRHIVKHIEHLVTVKS